MPTTFLNLTDLDNRIRDFEHRFHATTLDMLRDETVRAGISEDVLLKWETYVRQRLYLRELNVDTHSSYLEHLGPKSKHTKHDQPSDELALAA